MTASDTKFSEGISSRPVACRRTSSRSTFAMAGSVSSSDRLMRRSSGVSLTIGGLIVPKASASGEARRARRLMHTSCRAPRERDQIGNRFPPVSLSPYRYCSEAFCGHRQIVSWRRSAALGTHASTASRDFVKLCLWTFTKSRRRADESLGRAKEKARLAYRASRAGKEVCLELLEAVFQSKLHDAPRDRTRGDYSISRRAWFEAVAGLIELCVIPEVEELHPELKTPVFARPTDTGVLDDRRIKIELRAAARDS